MALPCPRSFDQFAKRVFDIVVATLKIVLFAPILLITSIAIKLDSPGPILIRETLFGYRKRAIRVHRFRFVTHCAETRPIAPRLTRVGRTLRQTGIGELPRLFSVLLGDMSIIGPPPFLNQQDFSEFPPASLLENVKPGMIDCAGPAEPRTAEQRVNDDLYYAANWSLYLDIKIILTALFAERPAKRLSPKDQDEITASPV